MVDRDAEENDKAEGLGMGNLVDVAYGIHEGLVGDLNGADKSEGGDLEPLYVLEPDLGQSQHTASQPSSSVPLPSHNSTSDLHTSQPSKASPTITKLPIEFNGDGIAVGPNHVKWNTQEEFEPNVPQATAHREVQKDFPQKFRSAKYAFRKEILRKCRSVEEAIAACPDGKDPNHWAAFVRNESIDEVRARNAKNAENAKKNIYRHNNGRDTYAHKVDKMDKEDPSRKHGRVDSWKKGHERRDGTILASAQTHLLKLELTCVLQASFSSNSELKGEMNEMKSSLSNVMGVLKAGQDLDLLDYLVEEESLLLVFLQPVE
ncbi:hypothetical protein IFM89_007540 [Coptis chinensis]|uniref:Uncharacterized protein n=1 Tax=Coptis chinensis TaxID=261450 RepID=A0A835LYU1_9MAGN|nr:hypothetical protein IFM89_007540 [Coptis chinensis]